MFFTSTSPRRTGKRHFMCFTASMTAKISDFLTALFLFNTDSPEVDSLGGYKAHSSGRDGLSVIIDDQMLIFRIIPCKFQIHGNLLLLYKDMSS